MARVLSASDVASGHIPNKASFEIVFTEVKRCLSHFLGISGVIQIGSIKRGDYDCCSDADVVVVFDRYERRRVFLSALPQLCSFASEHAVQLEFIPLEIKFAHYGAHTWTPSFSLHVKWAEESGGVITGFPATPHMRPRQENGKEALDYAVAKYQRILKNQTRLKLLSYSYGERLKLLEEVIQVPLFLIRKRVWDEGLHLPLDSKQAVLIEYEKIADKREAMYLEELLQVGREYRQLVRECRTQSYYEGAAKEILEEDGLESLLRFLEVTIERVG